MAAIRLRNPFHGTFPISFVFGAIPDNPRIKQKYREWGMAGHNGIDFALPEGTRVLAAAAGTVVQAGTNAEFGISVTIEHSWGQSVYAHLQSVLISAGDAVGVGDPIGVSGSSGTAFGPHLHFAMKPRNADMANGYLGYIDPTPYFKKRKQARKTRDMIYSVYGR